MTVGGTYTAPPPDKVVKAWQISILDNQLPNMQRYASIQQGAPGSFYSTNFNAPTVPAGASIDCTIFVQLIGADGNVMAGGQDSVGITLQGPPAMPRM